MSGGIARASAAATGADQHVGGATLLSATTCRFRVWAPRATDVQLRLLGDRQRSVPMAAVEPGWFEIVADDVGAGTRYRFCLDGRVERPDPASRWQPDGVHGPSAVVESNFAWSDAAWRGRALQDYVLYELHVGTFTPEGTFDSVVPRLDALADLGITAVEIMPVAQCPGTRNWGYDGAYPFAAQDSYGGAHGFKRLVDACHARGLAVVLDVVYNHLGPEGNYLDDFAPYFRDCYTTPWGRAINFDGPHSDAVRAYFIANALQWVGEFHVDALRLDAIHGIFDFSAEPFLAQLQVAVQDLAHRSGRSIHVIAESDLNDSRVIRSRAEGGIGLDAQWSDDFHHALHTLLTGERNGYYEDFGTLGALAAAFEDGYVYSGQYSSFRKRAHGNSSHGLVPEKFVIFAQNHDQVGNRARADRLSTLASFEAQKLAAGAVLLAPYVPLLFMGEEYGETAPFHYFISHGDADLIEAVRRGRRDEFHGFEWSGEPCDPQDSATFEASRIDWSARDREPHRTMLRYHRTLLECRAELAPCRTPSAVREAIVFDAEGVLVVRYTLAGSDVAIVAFCFGDASVRVRVPAQSGAWRKRIDSAETTFAGGGSPLADSLTSDGDLALELAPWSCVVVRHVGHRAEPDSVGAPSSHSDRNRK